MSPSARTAPASSESKNNRFSPSPDSEPSPPEQKVQPVSSKKKKKNAASKQAQINTVSDVASNTDVTTVDTPPPTCPQTILSQIPHGFPARRDSPLLDVGVDEPATSEKVSDQYTPPNDTWLEEDIYGKNLNVEPPVRVSHSASPSIQPVVSTRGRYDSKSPPISPPARYVRPISFGGVPPVPALPRGSPSAYTYAPSAYGSPPAPHLPQPHFYHAQDMNLGLPRTSIPHFKEEPTIARYTQLPPGYGSARQGILLGFESRFNVIRLENGVAEEIGALEGLAGTIVDAVLLECGAGPDPLATVRPAIAVVIHGPRALPVGGYAEGTQDEARPSSRQQGSYQVTEYTTRVEVYSILTKQRLAVLLETPPQPPQSAYRGAPPSPPNPIGQLKLQTSGTFLIVSSGVSGEVYAFTVVYNPQPAFECMGKFWTAIQPQIQRRDSSNHQSSDPDISPADLGRATGNIERAILSMNGRWLAISPAISPSRPSLSAIIGPDVLYRRHAGIETTSAPARPSVDCEVDSPDVDTLFSKVARGVAQELVKGARWLGDQGYQTWQSYWKKDQSPSFSATSPTYSPPIHLNLYGPNAFPPTHGDVLKSPKEPELVAVYDLQALHESANRKGIEELKPFATFQPPRGCSFISIAPHGLNMLTASRKGDVQYVWDLMQIRYCRTHITPWEDERIRTQPRVRQIAKYERLSGSTVVDVVWDPPTGTRFAVLTKNKTIHLFDLPSSAFRWPPPRNPNKTRQISKSIDSTQHDTPASGGFFASAMNIANQAQPMIANWRGRAPSMGGGLAGIGQTGIGLASATGARGGKAVAAGLSKSLGAASETVNSIRHAGESRLHLKSSKEPSSGRLFWVQRGRRCYLSVLEPDLVKQYQLRRNTNAEKRDRDVTVFAARKAFITRLPPPSRMEADEQPSQALLHGNDATSRITFDGFWKDKSTTAPAKKALVHPLSFAEIETNAPYQPFHSDRRVILSVYADIDQTSENFYSSASVVASPQAKTKNTKGNQTSSTKWVFGDELPSITLNISKIQVPDDENDYTGSVIYRETIRVSSPTAGREDMDQIVSTTRRRKVKKSQNARHENGSDDEKEDGFFEDDCDVLDFATDRV